MSADNVIIGTVLVHHIEENTLDSKAHRAWHRVT
jgi:tryptophan synthase alpha subunit